MHIDKRRQLHNDGYPLLSVHRNRNELCYCESGKKIKKCCGERHNYYDPRQVQSDFRRRINRIKKYLKKIFKQELNRGILLTTKK